MLWIALALVSGYVVARRLALGVDAAVVAAVTFASSHAVVGAALGRSVAAASGSASGFDPVRTGCVLVALGVALSFRRFARRASEGANGAAPDGHLSAAIGVGLAFLGVALAASATGAPLRFGLPSLPRPFDAPSAWIVTPAVALALVALLAPRGTLARRGVVTAVAAAALVLEAFPGAASSVAPVVLALRIGGALALALAAGEGLELLRTCSAVVRRAAAAGFVGLVLAGTAVSRVEPLAPGVARDAEVGELLSLELDDPAVGGALRRTFSARVGPTARIVSARIVLTAVDAQGARSRTATPAIVPLAWSASEPDGTRALDASLDCGSLARGHWLVELELLKPGGEVVVRRRVAVWTVDGSEEFVVVTLVVATLALGAVLTSGAAARRALVVGILVQAAALGWSVASLG